MIALPAFIFLVINTGFLLPGILLVVRGKWMSRQHLACYNCGYDLVGHSDKSVTCPECGTRMNVALQARINLRRSKDTLITGYLLIAFAFVSNLFFVLRILGIP